MLQISAAAHAVHPALGQAWVAQPSCPCLPSGVGAAHLGVSPGPPWCWPHFSALQQLFSWKRGQGWDSRSHRMAEAGSSSDPTPCSSRDAQNKDSSFQELISVMHRCSMSAARPFLMLLLFSAVSNAASSHTNNMELLYSHAPSVQCSCVTPCYGITQ